MLAIAQRPTGYFFLWCSVSELPAPLMLLGATALLAEGPRGMPPRHRDAVYAVLGVAALGNLVRYPFDGPTYTLYVAPLLILALVAALSVRHVQGRLLALFGAPYLLFAASHVNSGSARVAGRPHAPEQAWTELRSPRAHIRVVPEQAAEYDSTLAVIRLHASGNYLYAGPDAPELSFLAGLRNPSHALFDFLAPGPSSGPTSPLRLLRDSAVSIVVINAHPAFSRRVAPEIADSLRRWYPESATVGRFTVRWAR
jgi:hypothetical protein